MKNDPGSLKGVYELHELSCFHRFIDYLRQGYYDSVVNVQTDDFISAYLLFSYFRVLLEWKPYFRHFIYLFKLFLF